MSQQLLTPVVRRFATLLETQKRDGTWVGTPVNVAMEGDRAYFGTGASTGKVKRLRNCPDVRMTACSVRGRPSGSGLLARARLLEGAEAAAAHRALIAKNPIVFRCVVPLDMRIRRTRALFYELDDFRATAPEPTGDSAPEGRAA